MNNSFERSVEALPRELHAMLSLLNDDIPAYRKSPELLDWDMFYQLTKHHRVFPQVYVNGKEGQMLPADLIDRLRTDYQKNTFEMLQLSGEMRRISELLTSHGVNSLFLKGPVIAVDLYGEISLRTSRDLDLIIAIENLELVNNLLYDNGYEKEDYFHTLLDDWKWRHHHCSYIHPLTKIKVEVHWRLSPGPMKQPSFHELWKRRRISSISNVPIHYLGKEDLFLYLIVHGARHGWSRLRWLLDVDRLLRRDLDWEYLATEMKKYNNEHLVGLAIILTRQLLCTPTNEQINSILISKRSWDLAGATTFYLRQMISLHAPSNPKEVTKFHAQYRLSLMTFSHKCLYFLSMLLPNSEDLEVLQLPRSMRFLYYPLRPFLWSWRKIKGSKNKVFLGEL